MNYSHTNNKTIIALKTIFLAVTLALGLRIHSQDGSLDISFNSTGPQPGVAVLPISGNSAINYAVAITSSGKIITAGTDGSNFLLVAYTIDGVVDTAFGANGIVITPIGSSTTSFVNALALQVDGKILAAGTDGSNLVVARYLSNGSLDATFGTGGIVTTPLVGSNANIAAYAIVVQVDGKIVISGTDGNNFALARYTATGQLDTTFGTNGIVITPIAGSTGDIAAYQIAIQTNGMIVAIWN